MKSIDIYCDGGSRGNPGPAASAAVVVENDQVLATNAEFIGINTNNQAEYRAVLLGLELMEQFKTTKAHFYLDSQLVVRQIQGQYKVKDPGLRIIYLEIMQKLTQLEVEFTHVLRAKNKLADAAVNDCLDASLDKV